MEKWDILVTRATGAENMKRDIALYESHENGSKVSTLGIYSWTKPCISLGYSQKIDDEIDVEKVNYFGWDIVQRPTGGGIVFHNKNEVTYSIITSINNELLPNNLVQSYKKISEAIVFALNSIGISTEISHIKQKQQSSKPNLCFSYPAEYEIVSEGRKIVGSAQKRGKLTLLQQGSIFMSPNEAQYLSMLKKPYLPYNAISVEEIAGRKISFDEMSGSLINGFAKHLGVELV